MSIDNKWLIVPALTVVAACGSSPPASSNRTSIELATGSPDGIAVDSTYVYWINMGGGPAGRILSEVTFATEPLGRQEG